MVLPDIKIPYTKPAFEVAEVFRLFWTDYLATHKLPLHHLAVIEDLLNCRTAALGGHLDECDSCGARAISYNSCRNRHCPKCQGALQHAWVASRLQELLPIPYFHVVFTLPDELNLLAQFNARLLYTLLFKAASSTLLAFGERHLGGEIGVTAVLHTWGQTLQLHPHLHCIVTGGALSKDGRQFKRCRNGYLFPVRALSMVFRAKLCDGLKEACLQGKMSLPQTASGLIKSRPFLAMLVALRRKKWVVYTKRPFAGGEEVVKYIGRYTHKVAIANQRIQEISAGKVSFTYKDYREGGRQKVMRMAGAEFIRRFLLHLLPAGFVRIRHYGLYANGKKGEKLASCRALLAPTVEPQAVATKETTVEQRLQMEALELRCPSCKVGNLIRKLEWARGCGPPSEPEARQKAMAAVA